MKNILKFIDKTFEKQIRKIELLLSFTSIFFINSVKVFSNGNSPHDDYLLMRVAMNILDGSWFGQYDSYILAKNPSYQFFLAFSNLSNIPYLILLSFSYVGACYYFYKTISNIIANKYLSLFAYIYLLFSPIMYNVHVVRIYRMSIIPFAVILVFTSIIAMYVNRYNDYRNFLKHSLIASFCLLFFWYIREDSVWILPFVICGMICILVCLFNRYYKQKDKFEQKIFFKRFITTLLPIVILFIGTNVLSLINYSVYGVYTVSDYNGTYYKKVVSIMKKIEQDEDIPYVILNHSTLQKVYEVSPTFLSIKDEMENMFKGGWELHGTEQGKNDGEIEADYFFWALRDAVRDAGYYVDAKETNEFYKKIYFEINDAFENGTLDKKTDFNFALGGIFRPEKIFNNVIESVDWNINYTKINISINQSQPPYENLDVFEFVTGENLIYKPESNMYIKGWGFPIDSNDKLNIIVEVDNNVHQLNQSLSSNDVYEHFNMEFEKSSNARFNLSVPVTDVSTPIIHIYLNDELYRSIKYDEFNNGSYINDKYKLYFDNLSIVTDQNVGLDIMNNKLIPLKYVKSLYQKMGFPLFVLSIFSIIYIFYNAIKKEKLSCEYVLVIVGIFLSFLVLNIGVGYAYAEKWNSSTRSIYLQGAYSMLEMFIGLSIGVAGQILINKKSEKKEGLDEIDNTNSLL